MNFVIAAKACENDLLAMNNNVCTKASIFIGCDKKLFVGSIISFSNINGSFNISNISSGVALLRILFSNMFDRNWPGSSEKIKRLSTVVTEKGKSTYASGAKFKK